MDLFQTKRYNDSILRRAESDRAKELKGRGPDALAKGDVELGGGKIQTVADSHRVIMQRNSWPYSKEAAHALAKLGRDKIPGGVGAGKTNKDFDPKALAQGVKVEAEHTTDPAMAHEIARDHLTEDPAYYTKLRKMEKKGGYAKGSVALANQVGRRVLPAYSSSIKTPVGARRAAKLVSKQSYAPGGARSLTPAPGATSRKPLPTVVDGGRTVTASYDPMLQGMLMGLAKHAAKQPMLTRIKSGLKPPALKSLGRRLLKGTAGLGHDLVTFGAGDALGSKLVPAWKPPQVKMAEHRKEAFGLLAASMLAPVVWQGAKALGRISRLPGKAVAKGLGPKTRTANTPEISKVAFAALLARLAIKAAPTIARLGAKGVAATAAKTTPTMVRAGAKRFAVSSAKNVGLAAGSVAGANALTHVARPKAPQSL